MWNRSFLTLIAAALKATQRIALTSLLFIVDFALHPDKSAGLCALLSSSSNATKTKKSGSVMRKPLVSGRWVRSRRANARRPDPESWKTEHGYGDKRPRESPVDRPLGRRRSYRNCPCFCRGSRENEAHRVLTDCFLDTASRAAHDEPASVAVCFRRAKIARRRS